MALIETPPASPPGKEGGDVKNDDKDPRGVWHPAAGELFIHSHIFESDDGAEHRDWDKILDDSAIAAMRRLVELRREHAPNSRLLIPPGISQIDEFVEDDFQMDFPAEASSGEHFVVEDDRSVWLVDGESRQLAIPASENPPTV